MPPVGRSLWRKVTRDGASRGVKAKTVYPAKPESWGDDPWPPDKVFTLIQAGLLNGKSIGWIPTKAHYANVQEQTANAWPDGTLVVEEWLLIEYAVGTIPVNPETVVEIVSKAAPTPQIVKALGWDEELFKISPSSRVIPTRIHFTPLAEIAKAVAREIQRIDLAELVSATFDRKRGKI